MIAVARQCRRLLWRSLATVAGLVAGACAPADLLNAWVPSDGYARVRGVAFGPHERHRLDVYTPDGLTGPAQVVVFFYGGAWETGARGNYLFAAEGLASQGFVVVVPDYRLYPEVRFPAFLEDGALALRWVRDAIAAYGGDPGEIFVMGHSAGAYNAVMLALDGRYLAARGLDRSLIRGVVGLAGPYDFLPITGPTIKKIFEVAPDLALTQPIAFADGGAPPMLLLTGADDTTVYPRNTHNLARRLRETGSDATERVYPDLGHIGIVTALSRTFRDNAPALADAASFIRERRGR